MYPEVTLTSIIQAQLMEAKRKSYRIRIRVKELGGKHAFIISNNYSRKSNDFKEYHLMQRNYSSLFSISWKKLGFYAQPFVFARVRGEFYVAQILTQKNLSVLNSNSLAASFETTSIVVISVMSMLIKF